MSQTRRKLIECGFGWGSQHGPLRKTKHRGRVEVACDFLLNIIACNPIRIPKLIAARPRPRFRRGSLQNMLHRKKVWNRGAHCWLDCANPEWRLHMSVWSPQAVILLVALVAALVYAINRLRGQNRRRNQYRHKAKR